MLMQEMTPELAAKWKAVWQAHRDRLTPNRKTGAELAAYLTAHSPTRPLGDEAILNGMALEVLENAPLREKLPQGAQP